MLFIILYQLFIQLSVNAQQVITAPKLKSLFRSSIKRNVTYVLLLDGLIQGIYGEKDLLFIFKKERCTVNRSSAIF